MVILSFHFTCVSNFLRTYSGLQVDITNRSATNDLTNYVESGEWELKSIHVKRNVRFYPCCPEEPYPDVIFYMVLRRRIIYYLFNIIFPCVWLSILSLVGFWLPPDSGNLISWSNKYRQFFIVKLKFLNDLFWNMIGSNLRRKNNLG